MIFKAIFLSCVLLPMVAWADAGQVYRQALDLAGGGRNAEAIAMLHGGMQSASSTTSWKLRMFAATQLLHMREQHQVLIDGQHVAGNTHLMLAQAYSQQVPLKKAENSTIPMILATLFPGAGHAWLGRWHDATTAMVLVLPMLFLTLWAWRRKMGPVTVFFGAITLWLWSGSVFSATSLAEREVHEAYLLWWQGMWQSSGLPGRMP